MIEAASYCPGLLGMNRRNAGYLLPRNRRKLYPLVDDKLKTKKLLLENGFAAPKLYFAITCEVEFRMFKEALNLLDEFVIKPANGSGGRGIVVMVNRRGEKWEKANGELISLSDISYHVSNILAGLYSLGGMDDHAFIEYCVHSHECFKNITYRGVPDIRVILYRGVPVMAMLRLPTKKSNGKANLHQGAIGAGVNMRTGVTTTAINKNKYIDKHPDTGMIIAGLEIPFWDRILDISSSIYNHFQLGYIGVDFVIDNSLGPMILELNARPGLNIQLANARGLLTRLEKIDSFGQDVERFSPAKRLALTRELSTL